jgi:hypothetical protein
MAGRFGSRPEAARIVLVNVGTIRSLVVRRRRDIAGTDRRIPGLREGRRSNAGDDRGGCKELLHFHLHQLIDAAVSQVQRRWPADLMTELSAPPGY